MMQWWRDRKVRRYWRGQVSGVDMTDYWTRDWSAQEAEAERIRTGG
jgi:hypothetical protein